MTTLPEYEADFREKVTKLVMSHIDRMHDICEEDPAERIIESFTSKFDPVFQEYMDKKFPNRYKFIPPGDR